MKFDKIDSDLLTLLQEDCKKTTKEYANSLNLSTTAVYERIRRLERVGAIEKYVALVNRKLIGKNFMVFCQVKLLQHTKEFALQFEREVLRLPEVVECYHVSGDYDYLLKVHVADMEAYREFLIAKLTVLQHIANANSTFMIGEIKNTTSILCDYKKA